MELIFYKTLHRVIRRLAATLHRWEDELYWRVIYHTPVGPNPHPPGTIEYHLHDAENHLAAHFRLHKVNSDNNPLTALIEQNHIPWPDQMGSTITTNPNTHV